MNILTLSHFISVCYNLWLQSDIEQPLAANDLWLARRDNQRSWMASGCIRSLGDPNRPAIPSKKCDSWILDLVKNIILGVNFIGNRKTKNFTLKRYYNGNISRVKLD